MMPSRCPYCGGRLFTAPQCSFWQYDCEKCGRAWSITPDKSWIAYFDAANTIYSAEKVKERLKAMGL